jgi:glycosyltransferase involved in cell wall biosynthesis
MRVLILDQAIPFPPIGGGALRTYHLARVLAARHEVTLVGFTFGESHSRPPFRVEVVECPWDWPPLYREMKEGDPVSSELACRKLEDESSDPWFVSWVASAAMCKTLERVLRSGFDLALIEHTSMAWFLRALPPEMPKILDLHNVHTRMSRRAAKSSSDAGMERALKEAARTERFEKRAVAECDWCLTVSDEEAEAARNQVGARHVEIIPNGVDTSFFTPCNSSCTPGNLLFTGMMDYEPNVDAAQYFAHQVLPRIRQEIPEAKFHIVGAHPVQEVCALASEWTIVHGFVADVRPYYYDAAAVVVPLRHGGGTRLKILEAAACGKAVVSTSLGSEGLRFQSEAEVLAADSAEKFAEAVVRVCRDASLRERLGQNSRRVAESYDWDAIGARLCDVVTTVAHGRKARAEPYANHQVPVTPVPPRAAVQGRVFLVGCPRSGTTLLQSLLAAHPRLASFPESHFFPYLVPDDPWQRAAEQASEEARPRWNSFMEEIGRPDLALRLPASAHTIREYVEAFVSVLDALTLEQRKDWWLEKTPDHIRFLDVIEEYIRGARFVHLIRNGADVVASLYEVTRQHPKTWGGAWSADRCIDKWNEDVGRSLACAQKPNHILVRYEELVDRPQSILKAICGFIGIDFHGGMLEEHAQAAHSVILTKEVWKLRAAMPVSRTPSGNFHRFFDPEQQAYILDRLLQAESLRPLSEAASHSHEAVAEGGTRCC